MHRRVNNLQIDALRQSLRANPALRLSILTDYLRGNRETPAASCATLLLPLIQEFPDRVDVRMYHTPNLTGLRKRVIPKRLNEGWGLQHMKLYGFDDEILLSGYAHQIHGPDQYLTGIAAPTCPTITLQIDRTATTFSRREKSQHTSDLSLKQ